ncbi:glyoxylase-like metal-dependent hydrolase (beta-lactamase superfamily II) [Sinobacterium caligoides]|uniref:Glyoxylase-like metal-dependent hydrolase (Beta-lactamase superfamily II) n=1 Tax=Sinobacterium caligoides TaxID=933926 RepID=A0A3N2DZQ6_9GAMM|nr:MBL fold metallo-hydrolase [Sinobacterium caligoides]ROS05351.1 glyoxylase-like metal-dependent hydrolase (beta-lactamase superfamily II) [Sinobacterium caligoides]
MGIIHKIDHPQVEGIRLGRQNRAGQYRINTSCIIYRLGDTIVDTGPTAEWKLVKRYLEERPVRRALITHYHEDHSGNGGNIECCFNAAVHCHHNSHQRLREGFKMNLSSRMIFGKISLANPTRCPEVVEISPTRRLQALHMPGHTDDLTTFLEPNEGWLFSGDLYVAKQVRFAHHEENIQQQIESLRTAVSLDFDTLFCAHRGHIANGKQVLQQKLDFLTSFREKVILLHSKGYSRRQITHQLLGREGSMALLSGFAMSKGNLVAACLKDL